MDQSASIRNLRDGAQSTLQAFNPTLQRVALGFTGPTSAHRTRRTATTGATRRRTRSTPAPPRRPGTRRPSTPSRSIRAADRRPDAGVRRGRDDGQQRRRRHRRATTSCSCRSPPRRRSGDFLLATIVVNDGSSTTITPPAGWTLIRRTNGGTNIGLATYRRFAGSSEPASTYTFGLSNSRRAVGGIVRYTGVDTAQSGHGLRARTTATTARSRLPPSQ